MTIHSDDTQPPTTSAGSLLRRVRDLLDTVETVLVHAGPDTQHEITQILVQAKNYGGYGMLIDMVQLTRRDLNNHLNNH